MPPAGDPSLTFQLFNDDNEVIANAVVVPGPGSQGGKITITFTDKVEDKDHVKGSFFITAKFADSFDPNVENPRTYYFSVGLDPTPPVGGDVIVIGRRTLQEEYLAKWYGTPNYTENVMLWELRINYSKMPLNNVVLTDVLSANANQDYLPGFGLVVKTPIEDSFRLIRMDFDEYGSGIGPGVQVPLDASMITLIDITTPSGLHHRGFELDLGNLLENGESYLLQFESKLVQGANLRNDAKMTSGDRSISVSSTFQEASSGGTGSGDLRNRIKIIKIDSSDQVTRLANAQFQLSKPGMAPITLTTDANGEAVTQVPLEAGDYTLTELVAPEGYLQLVAPIQVTVYQGEASIVEIANDPLQTVQVQASKTWAGGPASDHTAPALLLLRDDVVLDPQPTAQISPASGTSTYFTYLWDNLPKTDLLGNEYDYSVREAGQGTGLIDIGGNTYRMSQTGNDITNTYVPPETPPDPSYPELRIPLSGRKVLKNGTLRAGDFTFLLKDRTGKVLAQVTNAKDGSFVFPDRTFTKQVSNYLFTIHELEGTDPKITYDKTLYTLKVTTRAVNGQLTATLELEKNGTPYAGQIVFTNQRKLPSTGDRSTQTLLMLFGASALLSSLAYASARRHRKTGKR